MNYKNRSIEKTLEKMIGVYPVIAITGPRQVGKTTLLEFFKKNSEQKIHYVTLDDFLWRTQANEDPELFLRNHETPLIIDEFQYAPNLLNLSCYKLFIISICKFNKIILLLDLYL